MRGVKAVYTQNLKHREKWTRSVRFSERKQLSKRRPECQGRQLSWHCFMAIPRSPFSLDTIQRRKQQLFPKVWGNIFGISSFSYQKHEKRKSWNNLKVFTFPSSFFLALWRDKVCVSVSLLQKRRCFSLRSASRTVFRRFFCVTGLRTIELSFSPAYLEAFEGIVSSCFVATEIATR